MLMNQTDFLKTKFNQGLDYAGFVKLAQVEGQQMPWEQRYSQLALDAEQSGLVGGFTRKIHVLCLTGTWCGDCAHCRTDRCLRQTFAQVAFGCT